MANWCRVELSTYYPLNKIFYLPHCWDHAMNISVPGKVYFIPGRNEGLDNFISHYILDIGCGVVGREILPPFSRLRFREQLKWIRLDLSRKIWHPGAVIIGKSYGAYLILHSLASMSPFPGRILLFSPVLGAACSLDSGCGSIPPRAKKLSDLAEKEKFPHPRYLEIHTGSEDNGCEPSMAISFSRFFPNSNLSVIQGADHHLSLDYIREVLDRFFTNETDLM